MACGKYLNMYEMPAYWSVIIKFHYIGCKSEKICILHDGSCIHSYEPRQPYSLSYKRGLQ